MTTAMFQVLDPPPGGSATDRPASEVVTSAAEASRCPCVRASIAITCAYPSTENISPLFVIISFIHHL